MALWQFSVFLVPPEGIEQIRASSAARVSDIDLPALPRERHDQFIERLQAILPRSASYAELEDYFGNEDEVTLRRERVSWSLLLRVDLRHYGPTSRDKLDRLLQLAEQFGLVALLDDMTTVSPRLEDVEGAARESRAAKFVQDPRSFFEEKGA
jgi:hypothetical protein